MQTPHPHFAPLPSRLARGDRHSCLSREDERRCNRLPNRPAVLHSLREYPRPLGGRIRPRSRPRDRQECLSPRAKRKGMKSSGQSAFTLVEMLVVIGIIVLLIGIAVPMLNRAWKNAVRTRMAADLQAIATGLDAYRQDFKDYPRIDYSAPGAGGATGLNVLPTSANVQIPARSFSAGRCSRRVLMHRMALTAQVSDFVPSCRPTAEHRPAKETSKLHTSPPAALTSATEPMTRPQRSMIATVTHISISPPIAPIASDGLHAAVDARRKFDDPHVQRHRQRQHQ